MADLVNLETDIKLIKKSISKYIKLILLADSAIVVLIFAVKYLL